MDGGDLRRRAETLEDRDDLQHLRAGQGRHVLAEVDGEIGHAEGLVGGGTAAPGTSASTVRRISSSRAASCVRSPDGLGKVADELVLFVVVAEIEGAVLADHAVDRPLPRDEIAPARRAGR